MGNPVVHFEIGSRDHEKLCSFYSKTFGWNITAKSPFIRSDNKPDTIGGHINCLGHEPHNYVTVYIAVDDLQKYLDTIEKHGGKTLVPPTEVPQTGTFAWFSDPEGNTLGLWKPAPGHG